MEDVDVTEVDKCREYRVEEGKDIISGRVEEGGVSVGMEGALIGGRRAYQEG